MLFTDFNARSMSPGFLAHEAMDAVQSFSSAEDFLQNYSPDKIGCLLLDLRMPGMTGIELLEFLRGKHIELPAIILTAHGDVAAAVRTMKLGVLGFLEKPVNPAFFSPASIRRFSSRRAGARTSK